MTARSGSMMLRAGRLVAGSAAAAVLAGVGYGVVTWYRYGRTKPASGNGDLLDRFMPNSEVREGHKVRVAAPADVTFAAARELELNRSPLVRAIFRGRELLMGSTGTRDKSPEGTFLEQVLSLGWRILAEDPGREVVLGAVTQPWQADVATPRSPGTWRLHRSNRVTRCSGRRPGWSRPISWPGQGSVATGRWPHPEFS